MIQTGRIYKNNKFFHFGLILLILTCVCPKDLLAQTIYNDIYTSFINLDQSDGLSDNSVNDIYQDVNGFIWIATHDGLNRFDGNKFVSFKVDDEDSISISNNFITSITGDSRGNIWIGTENGLNKYDRQKERFTKFKSNPENPQALRNNHVRKICLQSDSVLWVETIDGTLSRLDIATGDFEHFSHKPISQPTYLYHALMYDDNGDIWLGGRNLGIHILDVQSEEFRIIEANAGDPKKKRDNDLAAVLKTKKGEYFLSGIDGFYTYQPNTEIFEKLYASSTYSLTELADGRILMGTSNGLVIYDSEKRNFVRYLHDEANSKSLINSHVNVVFSDRDGNIWAGTDDGISLLKKAPFAFNNYFHIPGNPNSLSGNRVSSILRDSKNRVWIGTASHGLNRWNDADNTFEHFVHNTQNPTSISSDKVSDIYEDRNGDIWIGLWSGVGFNKFNPEQNIFTRYALNKNSLKTDWYNDILEDSNGNFWLGIWGGSGFQAFDRNKGEFSNIHFNSGHVPLNYEIDKLVYDGVGNLFVKTESPLIFTYNIESQQFNTYISREKYLSDKTKYKHFKGNLPFDPDTIYDIASNKNGLTLIATNNGLMVFNANTNQFSRMNRLLPKRLLFSANESCFYAFTDDDIFTLNELFDIISDAKLPKAFWKNGALTLSVDGMEDIWITAETGIFRFSPGDENLEKIEIPGLAYKYGETTILTVQNEILIGTKTGIWRGNPEEILRLEKISIPDNSPFHSHINGLIKYNDEQVLVVSDNGFGLLELSTNKIDYLSIKTQTLIFSYAVNGLDAGNGKFFLSSNTNVFDLDFASKELIQLNKRDKYMVSSRLTTCMLEDKTGNIWVGTTNGGLNRLNPETETFDHFTTENTNSLVADDEIISLCCDNENTIWIGTGNGLSSYNQNTGQFTYHSGSWNDRRIESILCTSDSILWLGTDNGLVRYNIKSLSHQIFQESDGLPTNSFNKGACQLPNGQVVMATNQGIISFNPGEIIKTNQNITKTKFTGFSLLNKPSKLNIESGDIVKLRYNENLFTIDFSTLKYTAPNSTEFVYNMTGMKENWISTNTPSVNFSSLPAGKYIFNVSVKGFENQPEAHSNLVIFISPPFWKTWWFWALIFVLIGSVAAFLVISYIKQLKTRSQNTILEQKLLTSQMNPHFISNSLSAIQSFIYKSEPETAGNYLSDFSRLVRLILENSRSELVTLDKEIKTLKLYINQQQLRFAGKFNYEIFIEPELNTKTTCIPPMLAQPFVENSIEHGIMHIENEGHISIRFGLTYKNVTIEIIDNGIGIKKSKLINERRETRKSFATSIAYERLANLTKKGYKNIGISITDRSETEGVNGTRVFIEVPFRTLELKNEVILKR